MLPLDLSAVPARAASVATRLARARWLARATARAGGQVTNAARTTAAADPVVSTGRRAVPDRQRPPRGTDAALGRQPNARAIGPADRRSRRRTHSSRVSSDDGAMPESGRQRLL